MACSCSCPYSICRMTEVRGQFRRTRLLKYFLGESSMHQAPHLVTPRHNDLNHDEGLTLSCLELVFLRVDSHGSRKVRIFMTMLATSYRCPNCHLPIEAMRTWSVQSLIFQDTTTVYSIATILKAISNILQTRRRKNTSRFRQVVLCHRVQRTLQRM